MIWQRVICLRRRVSEWTLGQYISHFYKIINILQNTLKTIIMGTLNPHKIGQRLSVLKFIPLGHSLLPKVLKFLCLGHHVLPKVLIHLL